VLKWHRLKYIAVNILQLFCTENGRRQKTRPSPTQKVGEMSPRPPGFASMVAVESVARNDARMLKTQYARTDHRRIGQRRMRWTARDQMSHGHCKLLLTCAHGAASDCSMLFFSQFAVLLLSVRLHSTDIKSLDCTCTRMCVSVCPKYIIVHDSDRSFSPIFLKIEM